MPVEFPNKYYIPSDRGDMTPPVQRIASTLSVKSAADGSYSDAPILDVAVTKQGVLYADEPITLTSNDPSLVFLSGSTGPAGSFSTPVYKAGVSTLADTPSIITATCGAVSYDVEVPADIPVVTELSFPQASVFEVTPPDTLTVQSQYRMVLSNGGFGPGIDADKLVVTGADNMTVTNSSAAGLSPNLSLSFATTWPETTVGDREIEVTHPTLAAAGLFLIEVVEPTVQIAATLSTRSTDDGLYTDVPMLDVSVTKGGVAYAEAPVTVETTTEFLKFNAGSDTTASTFSTPVYKRADTPSGSITVRCGDATAQVPVPADTPSVSGINMTKYGTGYQHVAPGGNNGTLASTWTFQLSNGGVGKGMRSDQLSVAHGAVNAPSPFRANRHGAMELVDVVGTDSDTAASLQFKWYTPIVPGSWSGPTTFNGTYEAVVSHADFPGATWSMTFVVSDIDWRLVATPASDGTPTITAITATSRFGEIMHPDAVISITDATITPTDAVVAYTTTPSETGMVFNGSVIQYVGDNPANPATVVLTLSTGTHAAALHTTVTVVCDYQLYRGDEYVKVEPTDIPVVQGENTDTSVLYTYTVGVTNDFSSSGPGPLVWIPGVGAEQLASEQTYSAVIDNYIASGPMSGGVLGSRNNDSQFYADVWVDSSVPAGTYGSAFVLPMSAVFAGNDAQLAFNLAITAG